MYSKTTGGWVLWPTYSKENTKMNDLVEFETEEQERARVVSEVLSWIGTPYHSNADLKGVGVDCGMILVRVFANCGFIDPSYDPRPYPMQWPLHQSTEKYLEIVRMFAKELPEDQLGGPGDIVVFKLKGSRTYHHGGIVAPTWPWIVHAVPPGPVMRENVKQHSTLNRLVPKFFSIWPRG